MAHTAAGLVAHVKAQLGQIYWYGTFGQAPTLDLLEQKIKQYPKYYTPERVANAKKNQIGKPGARVFDCAGLVKSYWMMDTPTARPKYLAQYDKSASMLKACCTLKGKIAALPEEPGLLVFIGTAHVGVYIGSGRVVEARGFSHGVVETVLKERAWDAWGRLDWLEPEAKNAQEAQAMKSCPTCGVSICPTCGAKV
ncbi:MAG: C40 family peptidase [Oscillospiraceae bacterium]|nr:C40 family peptidase [Oscillospiraceae bacterium]